MASKLYTIRMDTNTIADIKAALQDKSLITAVQYETTEYFIFTTPLVPNKYIKIYKKDDAYFKVSYATGWTSGATVTGETLFLWSNNSGGSTYFSSISLVADTNFFCILTAVVGSYPSLSICYVGAFNSSDILCFGATNYSSYGQYCKAYNVTDSVSLQPVTLAQTAKASGHVLTIPLFFVDVTTKEIQMNGSAFAETVGVKVAALDSVPATAFDSGAGFIITPSTWYMNGSTIQIRSSLLVEYAS